MDAAAIAVREPGVRPDVGDRLDPPPHDRLSRPNVSKDIRFGVGRVGP
jgi:hypothetical protein